MKKIMLNMFNMLPKKTKVVNYNDNIDVKSYKHYPSSVREWKNSIYVFNKNNEKLIPSTSNLTFKLIKSYFNLYNKHLEFKMRTKRLLLRLRRLSSNKFYISDGGFKHTNNKVSINIYMFNRQKTNYLLTLKRWFLKHILKTSSVSNKRKLIIRKVSKAKNIRNKSVIRKMNVNKNLVKRIREINKKGSEKLNILINSSDLLVKALNIIKNTKNHNLNNKSIIKYTENFYKELIRKSLRKIRTYFYYKQLMFINKSKLNYTYLQFVKKYLESIYNKNVEFNIINLRRFYLNSDILSESVSLKLARNRRKMLTYLRTLKDKVVIKRKKVTTLIRPQHDLNMKLNITKDGLKLRKYILDNFKYKHVTGFRLEAKGRLNKRFTASRSMSKLIYKGNLLELESSSKSWSSVLLKGNLKPNTQYTKIKSKSRIGSFGIKGWISGN